MTTLVFDNPTWTAALRSLAARPAQFLTYTAGRNMRDGSLELLAQPAQLRAAPSSGVESIISLYVAASQAQLEGEPPASVLAARDSGSEALLVASVGIGIEAAQGYLRGRFSILHHFWNRWTRSIFRGRA